MTSILSVRIMLFLRLFYEFFKTGLFAVGGGMATIPFLYNMADNTGWFTRMDVDNMIAVGESTPGPIGVNMATYVGYITGANEGGLPGPLSKTTPLSKGTVWARMRADCPLPSWGRSWPLWDWSPHLLL